MKVSRAVKSLFIIPTLALGSVLPCLAAVGVSVPNSSSTTPLQLCAGGTAKTFTAMGSGIGGSGGTETQTPASPAPYANLSPSGPQTLTNGSGMNVTYRLTPLTATPTVQGILITATANGGGSASATEYYAINGPLTVTQMGPQPTLTFNGSTISGTQSQTFSVSDPGPPIAVTATIANTSVASFSSTSRVATSIQTTSSSTGTASFTVYPVGSSSANTASTNITFTDAQTCLQSAPNSVAVNVIPGVLSLSTASLSFNALGTSNNQVFTAQEYNYIGTLTASSSNTTVATVSPASTPAPGAANSLTYTVTPVNFGKSTITVSDVRPTSQTVSVLVSGGTISISGSKVAAFPTISDNTNQHVAASPVRVTGSVETTASGGANVYVLSPGDIIGSSGDLLKIAYLTYNCTSNDSSKNQGGSFATGFLQLIANTAAANCLTFGNAGGTGQYADLDININLFLDDRTVPADTYNTGTGQNNAFQVVLSAT